MVHNIVSRLSTFQYIILQIWERMVPAVWRLCLWALEALSELEHITSSVEVKFRLSGQASAQPFSAHARSSSASRVNRTRSITGLTATVLKLCSMSPNMRETVVNNLLSKCYATADESETMAGRSNITVGGYSSSSSTLLSYPPLGRASEEFGILSVGPTPFQNGAFSERVGGDTTVQDGAGSVGGFTGWRHRKALRLTRQSTIRAFNRVRIEALVSATVLEEIVRVYADIGGAVLTSLMDRLQNASDGGNVQLPFPAVLHW